MRSLLSRAFFCSMLVLPSCAHALLGARPTTQNVISYIPIGHSAPGDQGRHIGYGIKAAGGWAPVLDQAVREYAWGVRRWQLHNPFGTETGKAMQFDQFLRAREAGLNWVTDDFVKRWRPFTAIPGVEVIGYLGTPYYLGADQQNFDRSNPAAYFRRFTTSVQPLLDAGMSVGFDTSSRFPPDHPAYYALRMIHALGVRVYTEPLPFEKDTYVHDLPTIVMWRDDETYVRPAYVNEECIAIMDFAPERVTRQNVLQHCRRALAAGFTIAVKVSALNRNPEQRGLIELGITLDDLLTGIEIER